MDCRVNTVCGARNAVLLAVRVLVVWLCSWTGLRPARGARHSLRGSTRATNQRAACCPLPPSGRSMWTSFDAFPFLAETAVGPACGASQVGRRRSQQGVAHTAWQAQGCSREVTLRRVTGAGGGGVLCNPPFRQRTRTAVLRDGVSARPPDCMLDPNAAAARYPLHRAGSRLFPFA